MAEFLVSYENKFLLRVDKQEEALELVENVERIVNSATDGLEYELRAVAVTYNRNRYDMLLVCVNHPSTENIIVKAIVKETVSWDTLLETGNM